MSIQRRSILSTDYVRVLVRAFDNGVVTDPTHFTVELALKKIGLDGSSANPGGGDWYAGSWETVSDIPENRFYARLLVGPGSPSSALTISLTGRYWVWYRVTASPEIPAERVYQIEWY